MVAIGSSTSEIIHADPFRCRMWAEHDRLEDSITGESCKLELESVARHGQLVPALARRLIGDSSHDFELICGARRLFVARYLNVPLKIEVRRLSDQEAIIALDLENRHRKDVSPYERGHSYNRWLRAGYFKSQDELAMTLGISASQVSRMLKLTQLPAVVVNAFASPLEIRETWACDLNEMLRNPASHRALIERARIVARQSPRPDSTSVYNFLKRGLGRRSRNKTEKSLEVVMSADGRPLFHVKRQGATVSLILPAERLSELSLQRLKRAIADTLQPERAQVADSKARPIRIEVDPPLVRLA